MLYNTDNQHGGDIYHDRILLDFSVSINPLGTPEGVREAIRHAAERVTNYPDPYCRELVEAIAEAEEVPKEWILCGNGAAELIYSFCQVKKGCLAVETAPAFSEYSLGVQLAGGRMLSYPLKEEHGFVLDREFLGFLKENLNGVVDKPKERRSVTVNRPKVIFLCNPNNPDGRNIPQLLLEEVLAWCAGHDTALFLDECFLELSEHNDSMKPFLKEHPELFLLKAFTKTYAMPGIRLGYGLSSDSELLKQMSRISQPWNVSVPAQAAGIAALQEEDWIFKAREIIREERTWLSGELERMGFTVYPSEANFILIHGKPGLDLELRKRGIAIRNCADYQNLGEGWYRIGLKLHEENTLLVQALRECLQDRSESVTDQE